MIQKVQVQKDQGLIMKSVTLQPVHTQPNSVVSRRILTIVGGDFEVEGPANASSSLRDVLEF